MFNHKSINTQNAELEEINLSQSSPDTLSGAGSIPAKTHSAHAKWLCIIPMDAMIPVSIRPTLTGFQKATISSPATAAISHPGHSRAAHVCRLPAAVHSGIGAAKHLGLQPVLRTLRQERTLCSHTCSLIQ